MSKVQIELNSDGVKALLQSSELAQGIHNLAEGIVNGDNGYIIKDIVAPTRCISTIQIATKEKMQENLDNNELLTKLHD